MCHAVGGAAVAERLEDKASLVTKGCRFLIVRVVWMKPAGVRDTDARVDESISRSLDCKDAVCNQGGCNRKR